MSNCENRLEITCPSFADDGRMPIKHTGFAEDVSPAFSIANLRDDVVSIAVIMDDLDIPFIKAFNHWLIWNLPPARYIPEGVPYGATCPNGARQGIGYGKNRYRGPKQPFFIRNAHRYRFTVYALDCVLPLEAAARKHALLNAMSGHILQIGEIVGWYKP